MGHLSTLWRQLLQGHGRDLFCVGLLIFKVFSEKMGLGKDDIKYRTKISLIFSCQLLNLKFTINFEDRDNLLSVAETLKAIQYFSHISENEWQNWLELYKAFDTKVFMSWTFNKLKNEIVIYKLKYCWESQLEISSSN